jgi:hypothetical protein
MGGWVGCGIGGMGGLQNLITFFGRFDTCKGVKCGLKLMKHNNKFVIFDVFNIRF